MLIQIRREDEMIPDPELSSQIVELEKIAGRIFQTVIDQPGKAPQIRRFMDYYLPTTLKMLTGYRRLTERNVSGREAQATKERIESAMKVVLGAFNKQLETLYQNDMLDITTDIDVLETMLKQDSLLGSNFKIQDSIDTGTAQAGAQAHMKEEAK
jgi:5-bromo-4-chloroindolyl phosphate hydrolysis protein